MNRTSRWRSRPIVGAVVAGLVILLALWFWVWSPSLDVVVVEETMMTRTIVASGRVIPWARVTVAARQSGIVNRLAVREGEHVRSGQTLVQLDDTEEVAAVANSSAAVEQARQRLKQVSEVLGPIAEKELRTAEIELEQIRLDFSRQESLFLSHALARTAYEEQKTRLQLAEIRRDHARIQAQAYAPDGQEYRLVQAILLQAQSSLSAANVRLGQRRIVAPVNGQIIGRSVEQGDSVLPGKALFSLAGEGPVTIEVAFDERNLSFLFIGAKAVVSADAYPAIRFAATLTQIVPAVDPQRGSIVAKFRVDDPPSFLVIDMTVSVELALGNKQRVRTIPIFTVHGIDSPAPWVMAVRNGRTYRQPVQLGLTGDGVVEVLSGLKVGEAVLPVAVDVAEGKKVRTRRPHEA